jgi:glycosyltransferase involved in cell wall biosynthesis
MREREPLVTVRMATYNRGGLLLERSLPSVVSQTYERLEVVIVGDGCDDDTAKLVAGLGDPRVRFVNLPYHGPYPADPMRRWMVAGGTAMNLAAELAVGTWISPLDDDDEYVPTHVERLVETAHGGGFELVYGRVRAVHEELDAPVEIGSYPPELGQFSFNAAMYLAALRFFEYDPRAWVLEEPADWTMCRRMMATGVRIGFADEVLTVIRQAGPRWSGDDPAGKR